jgi:16S rRNA processing protein RimM
MPAPTGPSSSNVPPGLLEVGRIGRAHGVRGEVYVSLSTDRADRLAPGSILQTSGKPLTVVSAKAANDRWLVWFEGVADRTAAERLTGTALMAAPVDDPEALWVHDLIGAAVVETDGTERGTCIAVIANPAHDILELDSGALVPVIFVVSSAAGVITIDPPDGLFNLDD